VSAPRLEFRLDRIAHNARALVDRLDLVDITVCGVTKATLGSPEVARELLAAGVTSLGESRIEGVEHLRGAGVTAEVLLIRSPMLSQVDRVVVSADVSCNSEPAVVDALAEAARRQRMPHGIVLMVELGDLREGILPRDLESVVRQTRRFPNLDLRGIGTNLACQSGVTPDDRNMAELSGLATSLESTFGIALDVVSGGNSANLDWALARRDVGRVNDLRLGESILLGCEPLHRRPIDGLRTDAFTLVAEVIETKSKPTQAWGEISQTAFGPQPLASDRGSIIRTILAIGRQDVDPDGLQAPQGVTIIGASSDHLVVDAGPRPLEVGAEVRFGLDYSALLRAMTSPFVTRVMTHGDDSC